MHEQNQSNLMSLKQKLAESKQLNSEYFDKITLLENEIADLIIKINHLQQAVNQKY